MKKIAFLTSILIFALCLIAIFFISPGPIDNRKPNEPKIESLTGTEVDQDSSRKVMDYFLVTLGEQPLEKIKQQSTEFLTLDPSSKVNSQSFDQFIHYKKALSELEPVEFEFLDYNTLLTIHHQLLEVQRSMFNQEEQRNYFADENLIREMALDKLKLKEQATSDSDFNYQWALYIEDKPDYIQRSDKNATLLQHLNTLDNYQDQNKHLSRVELVGEEAAIRLNKLDSNREIFNSKIKDYLLKRDDIKNKDIGEGEKQQFIIELRNQSFSERNIRRVEALERIHDAS